MITLSVPAPLGADRTAVIDMATDYTEEYLHHHGTLPPGSLLDTSTMTLIIRKGERPIGALSMATGSASQDPGATLRSEIDTIFIKTPYRGKGYASAAVSEFACASPHMPFIRGPLHHPAVAHIAESLSIETADTHDTTMLDQITQAVLATVICEHKQTTCRSCAHTFLRGHFADTYDRLMTTVLAGSVHDR